jgi:hypothetical protein
MELALAHPVDWDELRTIADPDIALSLAGSPEFCGARTLREQCSHLCQFCENHEPVVPSSTIGCILGIDKSGVRYDWRCYFSDSDKASIDGRSPLLDAVSSSEIATTVQKAYARGIPWTIGDATRERVFLLEVNISAPRLDLGSKSQQILILTRAISIWNFQPLGAKARSIPVDFSGGLDIKLVRKRPSSHDAASN